MVRSCGACDACCIHLVIAELDKPEHLPCHHLQARRCRIYRERPSVCRSFECLWLAGKFRSIDRPDRSGVLAHLVANRFIPGSLGVNVVECRPGALDVEPTSRTIIDDCRAIPNCVLITTSYRDGRTQLYSTDQRWIAHFRTSNPTLKIPFDTSTIDALLQETED